ncbi:MAG: hypothetical protein IKY83_06195 [Proteobacteria bacterium]|nr:hypothetical protein [Pseudomonadota bacterium]
MRRSDRIEIVPAPDGSIESPGVGLFFARVERRDHEICLGILERFGRRYALVIPEGYRVEMAVQRGMIAYGDCIARVVPVSEGACRSGVVCQDASGSPVLGQIDADGRAACDAGIRRYPSPSDGFVLLSEADGKPFKKPGDRLCAGDIVAVIELMKVRIEVVYDGAEAAVFERYACDHRRGIRRGDPLFFYR